ncbi:MAG: hypothetical protein ACXAEN_12405 [Candidatus Thorarchaeota archaeon]|jgi:hypothetical protein
MGRHPLEADGKPHSIFEKWRYDAKEAEKRWSMITNCSYCRMNSAGMHESDCPLALDNQTLRYNPVNFITTKTPGELGWICPVCGGGNAPTTQRCPCRGMESTTFTATSDDAITGEAPQWLCECGVKNYKSMDVCYFCKKDRSVSEMTTSDAIRKVTKKTDTDH